MDFENLSQALDQEARERNEASASSGARSLRVVYETLRREGFTRKQSFHLTLELLRKSL